MRGPTGRRSLRRTGGAGSVRHPVGAWPAGRAAGAGALAAAVLLSTGACAAWREQPLVVLDEQLDGQAVVGVSAPGQSSKAVVVYFHGLYDSAAKVTEGEDLKTLTDALVGAGYAVVAGDARGDSFGSPLAQQDYAALTAAATQRYDVDDVLFLAESMGALSALPLAASGTVPGLRGTAAIGPAVNTAAPEFAPFADDAQLAWGRTLTPQDNPLDLPVEAFDGQHFRFYVTEGDSVVPTGGNASLFVDRVSPVAEARSVTCTGDHLDATCYQPDDLVTWFDGLLEEAHAQQG